MSAHGQTFTNLDFESAVVVSNDPTFGFLDWGLAVPGWSHSLGSDTGAVYYGSTHVGQTQWFRLIDVITSPGNAPLQGQYSMQFSSGRSSTNPPGPWVSAFLAQTGAVPSNALSLRFLATGPLAVAIDGLTVPIISTGQNAFGVDLVPYAGSTVELRFINSSQQFFDPVMLDQVSFSTTPIPEPESWLLLSAGLALGSAFRSRTQGSLAPHTR